MRASSRERRQREMVYYYTSSSWPLTTILGGDTTTRSNSSSRRKGTNNNNEKKSTRVMVLLVLFGCFGWTIIATVRMLLVTTNTSNSRNGMGVRQSTTSRMVHPSATFNDHGMPPPVRQQHQQHPTIFVVPPTTAQRCGGDTVKWKNLNVSSFHSQSGEDRHLLSYYFDNGRDICNGTYIELGALDGWTISNTYVFNTFYDWRGVLVELSPTNYRKLIHNRPNELVPPLHAAVCAKESVVHYVASGTATNDTATAKFWGTTGGIWEFMPRSFRKTWWSDIQLADTIPIRCTPLRRLLHDYLPDVRYYDFLSLDVEGAELQVLESINYDIVSFGIILVEADQHDQSKNLSVRLLLQRMGYIYIEEYGRSYWFVHPQFDLIYQHLRRHDDNQEGEDEDGPNNDDDDDTISVLQNAVSPIIAFALQQQQQH